MKDTNHNTNHNTNHISHGGEQLNPLTIKILCDLEQGTFNRINYSKFEEVDKEIQTLERLNFIQKGRFALNGNGKRIVEAICLHASNRFNLLKCYLNS